jgi:hypothetical protein
MQIEFRFNVLSDDIRIFEPAECRVVVTPDESLLEETHLIECSNTDVVLGAGKYADGTVYGSYSNGANTTDLGLCRRCKKGNVYKFLSKDGLGILRCTYCKW